MENSGKYATTVSYHHFLGQMFVGISFLTTLAEGHLPKVIQMHSVQGNPKLLLHRGVHSH